MRIAETIMMSIPRAAFSFFERAISILYRTADKTGITNTNESIVTLCFIAFYFIIFQAYQNRRGAGPVFYAFAMIGIASIFFVKIL